MATRSKFPGAEEFLPKRRTLNTLREASKACRGCDLYIPATQTVFGEGPSSARVVFVGEQPGNSEDLAGRPFVGPAGALFDRALAAAKIDREQVYVTNAVKHFSFEPRGKARLHKRPRPGEVRACAPWLRAELSLIEPEVLVLLGSTAAQSLFGPSFRITQERGKKLESELAPFVLATIHPSAVLRAPDEAAREQAFASLVDDLKV
ncbi:MAG TPA: UdgX family uracil-DNA binding protein, partial [Polyangiaceae bacterium]|nr:UdgX family uracil-DNA binding protein [Polyangiaceae bacterium]